MPTHLDAQNAISFLTAAIRVPTEWRSALLSSDELEERPHPRTKRRERSVAQRIGASAEQAWEIETHANLTDHLRKFAPRGRLLSLGQVAEEMEKCFPQQIGGATATGKLLKERRRRGMLAFHELSWLHSVYFPLPEKPRDDSTVVSFEAPGRADTPPWREYLFLPDKTDVANMYEELAAIYDVLGLLAQRRSLISVTAQRRICKIVLPWSRCRFRLTSGKISQTYLLVPVVTLLGRRATSQFRRTFTLTTFLLPESGKDDPDPALDPVDLAALCQQAVWNESSPSNPVLWGSTGLDGPAFEGPLSTFIITPGDHHLPVIFDAILARVIAILGVRPATGTLSSIQTLIAISRKHSVVFGSVLHVVDGHSSGIWNELKKASDHDLAEQLAKLLSVNAARQGREWLVGGEGFRLDKMRVTNPYEEDVNTIVLYNPMSRFMVNIMPQSHERFPTVSLKLGVSWLNLLASTLSSVKEILRSYRYEIEQYRNRIELLRSSEDPGALLKDIHKSTLTILEEIDVVYSFDLVTPTYKAAHTGILEMEGIGDERSNLMRELEITTALLRSEETDQLNRQIARSTSSTDSLTLFVVLFSALSAMLVVNGLVDFYHHEPVGHSATYWRSALWDAAIALAALLAAGGLLAYRRLGFGKR